MQDRRLPLVTIESQTPVNDFDVFAFSVSFEWDYTNVLTMLGLANIPVYAKDRNANHPLIVVGGAVTFVNPEPLALFADVIAAGEGEVLVPALADALQPVARTDREGPARSKHGDARRLEALHALATQRGFYILRYHPNGSKPSDVWDIIPEDRHKRSEHYAAFPEDLCRIPLLATCPKDGIALDPFCGTGTTCFVAQSLGRKSVGIDLSPAYIDIARQRCNRLL